MRHRFGITFRLTLAFVLFAFLILSAVGLLVYNSGRAALQNATTSGLISIALEKQAAINAWVDSRQNNISLLANSPNFMDIATIYIPDLPSMVAHDRIARELKSWVGSPTHFLSIDLVDPSTGIVTVSTDPNEEGLLKAGQPFFINGKVGPYVQNPYKTDLHSSPEITVSVPVISTDGRVLGFLAGQLNLNDLTTIVDRRSGIYQTDEALIINPSRLFVTQPRLMTDPAVLQNEIHTPQVDLCLDHNSGSMLSYDYRNVSVIVVYRWIPERNLCLIEKMDQSEAFLPVRALGSTIAIITGLALLISVALAIGLASTFTRPILALQAGVVRFGQGDLSTRLVEKGKDELAQLAHDFNLMAGELSKEQTLLHRHLDRLYDLSDDLIGTVGFDGLLKEVNPAFGRLLGFSNSELLSRPFIEFLHPDDWQQNLSIFDAVSAGRSSDEYEYRLLTKTGAWIWFACNASFDRDEKLVYVMARDLTLRKQEEAALKESESKFAAIFQKAPMAIALSTLANGELIDVNQAFEEMFGFTKAEVLGHTTSFVGITPDPRQREQILAQIQQNGFVHNINLDYLNRLGERIVISGNVDQALINGETVILSTFEDYTERQKVSEALIDSELRYRSLFENMQDGFAFCRMVYENGQPQDFIYLKINPAFESLTGLPNVVGMKVTEAIPGILKTNPELFIIYGRVAETGQPARFESFIEPLNRWLSISVYSSEKGTFIALFENITERKLAEEALRNNEKLYRAIGESIDYGVWVCDPQGRSIYTSDSFLKLVGMTQEQCSNDGWESALHPAERAATITAWNEFVRTGGVWDMEHRILGVDGLYHPILDRGVPIRGEQGEITAFAGINLDIGKQKKSEAALVLALDRFQRMVDSNIIGIVSARADGSILNSNDYYLDLIGYTQADLQVGRVRWTDVTPPEYLYLDRIALQELTVKGTSTPHEKEYHRPDGSRVWVSIVDTLLPGPEPEIAAFILDITKQKMLEASLAQQRDLLIDTNTTLEHELTERRRAEHEIQRLNDDLENKVHERTAQLATTNKELEAFAYSVSHDLRAPLRGIDGWSLALMEDNAAQLDAQGRVYLERVRAEARRMGQLIDDLLTLSRVTRAEMQTGSVDLSTLAQSVVDRLKSAQPERQVEVVIQPGLMAPGDAALVGVVFTNLFDNAWKFTGKTPAARIEFGQIAVDGLKPYFVRDNGVGFDMQYVNKLFGAFQRLHKMTEFPGTGIGLATVQRIIHRHGGQVWVEAVEGRGATFYFTLEDKV